MPGGVRLDVHAVIDARVRGIAQVVPPVHPVGEVVQAAVGAGDEGDVVRAVRDLEPARDLVAVVADDLLGEAEVEVLDQEPGVRVDLLGGEEDVVDPRRGDADQAHRPRRRVGLREQVADLLHAVDQLHLVPAGQVEADRRAVPGSPLVGGEAAYGDAGRLEPLLVVVEVLGVGDLEAEVVQPVGRLQGEDDAVVLVLVPALQEDPVAVPAGLDHADDLGVVGGGELEIGDPDLDVGQAQDRHQVCTFMKRSLTSPS